MTLKELYDTIGGDYDQALRVLRIEKLIDKHIRRFPTNTIFADMDGALKSMDANGLFESSHAMKGVCSNLGLVNIASLASEISEEFRPGNPRTMTDQEVAEKVARIDALYETAKEGIRKYESELNG